MKILLVDDHILFREGLVGLLNDQPDMQIVGSAGNVQEAIRLSHELCPDVILMDYGLPDGSGVDATQAIMAENPRVRIVFLTVFETDDRLFSAIRSGAKGYLLKNLPVAKLLTSLRSLDHNEAPLSREMTARVLEEYTRAGVRKDPEHSVLADVTLRELEIMRELALDSTNSEIARRLSISETTVKNHVHSLLKKMNMKNRREIGRFARHHSLT